MELFPAIDVRAGRCVRLRQGDYADETVYGDDPVAVAVSFAEAGARWVHTVDLDAARTGDPMNRPVIAAIAAAVAPFGAKVQTGGGVRNLASVEDLLARGVARVVIGTAAVEDPSFVAAAAAGNPGGVAVGLDARALADGRYDVAVRGWTEGSGHDLFALLAGFADMGVAAAIVTEIGRDGMLSGPDLVGLQRALDVTDLDLPQGSTESEGAEPVSARSGTTLGVGAKGLPGSAGLRAFEALDVIASGGVSSLDDLVALRGLVSVGGRSLAGAIAGKAIYERRFTVAEGVAACRGDAR